MAGPDSPPASVEAGVRSLLLARDRDEPTVGVWSAEALEEDPCILPFLVEPPDGGALCVGASAMLLVTHLATTSLKAVKDAMTIHASTGLSGPATKMVRRTSGQQMACRAINRMSEGKSE